MKMNLQHSKPAYAVPLSAIAVSAMLLMGSVTSASAGHLNGHRGGGLGNILGGAAVGALIGGVAKGKKGAAVGAGVGALIGAAASRPGPPPPRPVYAAPPPPRPAYPVAPPRPVYGGGLVYNIQASLTRLGYNPGPVDGVYGRRTADAIGAYEFNNQLAVTGQPSESLRYHLTQAGG